MSKASVKLFDSTNLPKLRPNSGGHAFPVSGVDVVACEVPCKASFPLPKNWGGGTMEVDTGQGYWITGLAPDDIYPNNEFETFYEIIREVSPENDERAKIVHDFWLRHGWNVTIYYATKTKPAIVVGVIDESGRFEGLEGFADIKPGDVLLESPINRGQMWRLEPQVFAKKYQSICPGPIPTEKTL